MIQYKLDNPMAVDPDSIIAALGFFAIVEMIGSNCVKVSIPDHCQIIDDDGNSVVTKIVTTPEYVASVIDSMQFAARASAVNAAEREASLQPSEPEPE